MAFTDNTTGGRVLKQGIMPIKITLTDTCHVGDLIGYEGVTDDEWQRADANGKVLAQLVAGEKCNTSGDEITCFKMAVIDGFTSATTGDMVYLADDVGAYASTPTTWVMQCVGEMVSDTEAFIHPSCSPVSAYASTGTGWAGYFRTELESGRVAVAVGFGGIRVDVKVIDGADLSGVPDIYGVQIFLQFQDTDAGSLQTTGIRIEDGCDASCHPNSYIQMVGGAVGADNVFDFGGSLIPTGGAWSTAAETPSGAGGWYKIRAAGLDRYVPMFTGSSGG